MEALIILLTSIADELGVHNGECSSFCKCGRCKGESHIHRVFPSMNPGLDSCSEFGIEEEGGQHGVLELDVFNDVIDLGIIIPAELMFTLLSKNVAQPGLT